MKLTEKQRSAALEARRRWGVFYLLGPSDALPAIVLLEANRVSYDRRAKAANAGYNMRSAGVRGVFNELKNGLDK